MQKAIFTIVSNNYLYYARTLLQSVAAQHPDCRRYCVIVDSDLAHAERFAGEFEVVRLEDLDLPGFEKFLFRYSILELNTAVKPWAFARLFAMGHREVVYIDPDIRLYAPMQEVFALLAADADIVLTPHLLAPIDDDREPSELAIRRAGTYNLGFCALARSDNASAFVAWWQEKLVFDCVVDQARGIFVDQSWIDLVPGLFPHVAILRDPGYNVAYWNLAQRPVARRDGQWNVAGRPLVFFHYSGFDAERPEAFSKHQNRLTLARIGDAKDLALEYAATLIANGARTMRSLPYGYGRFADGRTSIPELFRRLYRGDASLQRAMGDDPFAHPESLWALVDDGPSGARGITYALYAAWLARPDLRDGFPLTDAESIARFYEWFAVEGRHDHSQNVVEEHERLRLRLRTASSTDNQGVRAIGRTRFVRQTYFTVLGREADPDGLRINEAAAARRLGRLKVCVALLMSPESRNRPAWWARARRAAQVYLGEALALQAPSPVAAQHPETLPRPPLDAVTGVNIVGYVAAESGVGESARSFAKGCRAAGIPYRTIDVGHQNRNRQEDRSVLSFAEGDAHFRIDVLHVNADQTLRTLQDIGGDARAGDIRIGYWHWEQATLPTRFLPSFDGLTEVWVPSSFVHAAVAAISPLPVFKVPHVVEFAMPAANARAKFGLPADRFLALVMYDFDSYQARKNPQAAVEAFRRVVRKNPAVGLVIKTINGDCDPDGYRALADSVAELPNAFLIDRYLSRDDIYALENACDCFLSLHRSEGFGLGLAEMMFLGKPVIATAWSGNMEFMTAMNSMPIGYELRPLASDLGVYEGGQSWAEADVDQAADALGRLAEDGALRERIGGRARADMLAGFSAAAIGRLYAKRLSLLASRRP